MTGPGLSRASCRTSKRGHSVVLAASAPAADADPKSPANKTSTKKMKTMQPDHGYFRATETADQATSLTDGVLLASSSAAASRNAVILPWMGFGTYKLGKEIAYQAVLDALSCGYRCIDTAFIYGGETTERLVGEALQTALKKKIVRDRQEVFVVTKHWRKYHGYDATWECLNLSLKRLQLSYADLYLMHWPGPAWKTMNRRKDLIAENGAWFYAADHCKDPAKMVQVRSETWRAMEDALKEGKARSIGVSNFSVSHLKALKETATIWPPVVNQVEFHPLYPQPELLEYCQQEGILLQAYASLGGQDTGKKQWLNLGLEGAEAESDSAVVESSQNDKTNNPQKLLGKRKPKRKKLKDRVVSLLKSRSVVSLARDRKVTPAQVLLRWALSQDCVVIPKSSTVDRMKENAGALKFSLTPKEIGDITTSIQSDMAGAAQETEGGENKICGRLCWRNDPLRHLDFD